MNRQSRRKGKQPVAIQPQTALDASIVTRPSYQIRLSWLDLSRLDLSLPHLTWIRAFEALFLLIAFYCLTSYGWAVVRRSIFQHATPTSTATKLATVAKPNVIREGTIIEVPRLRVISRVIEDASDEHLDLGAAHVAGTALPGDLHGNVVIAGHRDHIFWPLQHIRPGDEIRLRTPGHSYSYFVSGMRVVEPDNLQPLDQSGTQRLTLLTCYPFHFVGHAPQRYVIEAEPRSSPAKLR